MFFTKPTFFCPFLPQIEWVCMWTGRKCHIPTISRGETIKSIFISFSGTFTDLLLVSPLYRARYGSLVHAQCLLTTLAALMVSCGKISAVSSLLMCARVSHPSGSGADRCFRPERGQCKRKGKLRPTLVFCDTHVISSWLDSKYPRRLFRTKQSS